MNDLCCKDVRYILGVARFVFRIYRKNQKNGLIRGFQIFTRDIPNPVPTGHFKCPKNTGCPGKYRTSDNPNGRYMTVNSHQKYSQVQQMRRYLSHLLLKIKLKVVKWSWGSHMLPATIATITHVLFIDLFMD